jgi:TolB-like protein/tetratricopeptide (TPR) repeat protein
VQGLVRSAEERRLPIGNLIVELKRRRVFRVLVGYGLVSFAVLQIIEPVMHALRLPDSVLTYCVIALAIGFPLAVVLAWAFDVNAGAVERTPPAAASAPWLRGPRLALLLLGLGLIAAAPGLAWYFLRARAAPPPTAGEGLAPGTPSIAVLPFVDLSPEKNQEYFSDGLTEELLNALAQVEGLQVAGRTSAFSFKGKNEDLRKVGAQLGVAHVLEGSVRKAGMRVRITAQVIKVGDGFHLWSQNFDRELTDIFAVQDEIARAVVSVLRVKLLPGRQPIPDARRTANPEAYAQCLLGKDLLRTQTFESYGRAVQAFEKAVALDPAYAPAHAGLSDALGWWSNSDEESKLDRVALQQRALAEAEKAVAAAPDLADGWLARGRDRLGISWEWDAARSDLEKARSLAPGDAEVQLWLGHLFAVQGRLPEAIANTRRAAELDPLSPLVWDFLGRYLAASGDLLASRAAFARSLALAPASLWANRELGFTYLLSREPAIALASFEKQKGWLRALGLALSHHDLGHAAQAQAALDELMSVPDPPAYQIAQVYAWWGDKDRAFLLLERARLTRDAGIRYLKYDPLLEKLRSDARWPALMRKLNLPD